MTTVRQIQRLWEARKYAQLYSELTSARPEGTLRIQWECSQSVPAAALAVIRLDELNQSYVPLSAKLIRSLIATQQKDGGWGDLMATALALRALSCAGGWGQAIKQGLAYLANLQKPEGIWPRVPLRRMSGDAFVSAFILQQIGDLPSFQGAIRFEDAIRWFATNETTLDPEARRLWDRARLKCRTRRIDAAAPSLWS